VEALYKFQSRLQTKEIYQGKSEALHKENMINSQRRHNNS
jgi:hypothetical protein